ncbi:hypothetical protein [Stieleria mannarensis]|uniref:hypothetical protein n=1 Tax=Stieleria mannarensis TaxID=2755585 RepID=UPI0015FEDD3A|nr:hypothetical protein [Rhodopirellula sp. JC639]
MPSKPPKRRKPITAEPAEPAEPADQERGPERDDFSIDASDLGGLKFFKKVRPFLETLQSVGTARDNAKHRDLAMDQYGLLVLMWLFNPILTSLRGLQQASELEAVQRKFGVGRASLGSLSESVTIFDPDW